MLQTSDFRGDGTIRTLLTPARRGKKNHIAATIIYKVTDVLLGLVIATSHVNLSCQGLLFVVRGFFH